MEIYNTLTRKKETFEPREDKKVQMFVCGPTVYDYIHIGNARTFVIFDVVAKYLKHKGYNVKYIQNITDIDDKIIKRAHDEGTAPEKLADQYAKVFLEDMTALGIDSPQYARATEYIEQIKKQVQKLIDRSYAYAVPALEATGPGAVKDSGFQDVYFDIQKYEKDFPNQYGQLSGQIIENLESEKRVEMEKNKRHPCDFVLWKAQNYSYDWTTDSPWGKGRPGWHIEDTAISESFFGPQYDIHGGGQDLIFPHHEAEIAQQQAASDKVPFVKYWMHTGFLVNKDEKMSKSLGNFMTLHDALQKYSAETLRYYFLSAHYRSPLTLSETGLAAIVINLTSLRQFRNRLALIQNSNHQENIKEIVRLIEEVTQKISSALDNDFNTPEAFATYFDFISKINILFDQKKLGKGVGKIISFIQTMDEILGIMPSDTNYLDNLTPEVHLLIREREQARQNKDWEKADEIREKLKGMGHKIDDTPYGPTGSAQ